MSGSIITSKPLSYNKNKCSDRFGGALSFIALAHYVNTYVKTVWQKTVLREDNSCA